MTTAPRILLSVILVLGGLALVAPARAADAVIPFDLASGDMSGVRVQLAPGMAGCVTGCAAASLRPGAAVPAGRRSVLSFSAPAGTTIVQADLRLRWRTAQSQVSARVQGLFGGRWIDQRRLRSAKQAAGTISVGQGATAVAVTLSADGSIPARRVASGAENAVAVDGVQMTVRDTAPPNVAWSGSAPETGGWQRGALCGGFAASDVGLGVDHVDYAVGGATATVVAGTGSRLQPRPGSLAGTVCVDSMQLADGTYGTALTATDTSTDGNRSATVAGVARVDNTAPAVVYQPPPDPEARLPQAVLTATDGASGVARVTATVDGVPAVLKTTGSSTTVAPAVPLSDGQHLLVWQAVDVAGNAATGTEILGVLDTTPPVIDDAQPQGLAAPTSAISAHAVDTGAGLDLLGWRIAVDGIDMTGAAEIGASGSIALQPVRPWGEGEHVVRVTAADRSGNRAVRTWTFALPVTPPPATPVQPAPVPLPDEPVPTADAVPTAAKAPVRKPAATVRLRARQLRIRAGARTTLSGSVRGMSARQVRIEARVGEAWRLVVTVPVRRQGAFATPVELPVAGGYDVRARVGRVTSDVVRITAR